MSYKLNQAGITRTAENLKCSIPEIYSKLLDILRNDTTEQFKGCAVYADFNKYDLFLIADLGASNTHLAKTLTSSDALSDIRTDNPFLIKFRVWFVFQYTATSKSKSKNKRKTGCPCHTPWDNLSAAIETDAAGPMGDGSLTLTKAFLLPCPDICKWAIPKACQCLALHFEEKVSQQELDFV